MPDPPRPGTTVLLVDAQGVIRDELRALLATHPDIEVVGAVATAAEAMDAVIAHHPDVVLMDYALPTVTGPAATAEIRDRHPEVAVVFLSEDDTEDTLLAAVEAGAAGYLVKAEAVGGVIASAVRRAAAGEMLVSRAVLQRLVERQRQDTSTARERALLVESLTARELDVLSLMGEGLDNQEVADSLQVSYLTVRGHVRNILSKLGVHSKLAAVAWAAREGLLPGR